MDLESPDVMRDFPGLYASELNKKGNIESDQSDEPDKLPKKDLLSKRKDKKDKKDKERGYAALEGESSAEETESRSPSKFKKTKAFKFSTKSKEKREKSREKDIVEKKKDKDKKNDKKIDKSKMDKKDRKFKSYEENIDIADGMPVFGVSLDVAVERSRCHDGIDIPLPIRACIDYVQEIGLTMEGVYKISGTKSKVIQLRKLYNQRENVNLYEYDVPTVTSLLKSYLRDLPEPLFTNELLIRFEEAGAILNVGTREKHLKILMENLQKNNRTLLSWLLIHFDNVVLNERHNKMNIQHVVASVSPALHTSHRLLTALLHHCRSLFPTVILEKYIPPLASSAKLPEELDMLESELKKQESLLSQIHDEMNAGYITSTREELLWEVQRIITQLKRRIKNLQKDKDVEKQTSEPLKVDIPSDTKKVVEFPENEADHATDNSESSHSNPPSESNIIINGSLAVEEKINENKQILENALRPCSEESIALLQLKFSALLELKEKLIKNIESEKLEIFNLKQVLVSDNQQSVPIFNDSGTLDQVMELLQKENQILEIKKMNLVRQIMEQEEVCIDLKAKLGLLKV